MSEVSDHDVTLGSGEKVPTNTLIWAAGVRAHPLLERLGLELTHGYRVKVGDDLSLPGKPYAFAVGDIAAVGGKGGPHPQLAPVAIQQGGHAAAGVLAAMRGQQTEPFRYFDKGIMAIIGRNAGVAELSPRLGGAKLKGRLGWLGWLGVHMLYLPGFENKLETFVNWAYNYVSYARSSRLIAPLEPSPADFTQRRGVLVPPDVLTPELTAVSKDTSETVA